MNWMAFETQVYLWRWRFAFVPNDHGTMDELIYTVTIPKYLCSPVP